LMTIAAMTTRTALMAPALPTAGAPPIQLPYCWTHPLVLVPCVLMVLWSMSILIWTTWHHYAALVALVITGVLTLAWICLLTVLYMLGCAFVRDEGPKPHVSNGTLPMHVDVLRLENGALGMSQTPGRKRKGVQRALCSDVDALRDTYGFDVVVTLLEDREISVMDCQDIGKVVESRGMQWIHFPMRDKWLPDDTFAFLTHVVQPVAQLIREGKRVLIHCNGGKGRTGLVVSSVLMTSLALGNERCRTLSEAVKRMRTCRPGMLKNPLQNLYMWHIQSSLAAI